MSNQQDCPLRTGALRFLESKLSSASPATSPQNLLHHVVAASELSSNDSASGNNTTGAAGRNNNNNNMAVPIGATAAAAAAIAAICLREWKTRNKKAIDSLHQHYRDDNQAEDDDDENEDGAKHNNNICAAAGGGGGQHQDEKKRPRTRFRFGAQPQLQQQHQQKKKNSTSPQQQQQHIMSSPPLDVETAASNMIVQSCTLENFFEQLAENQRIEEMHQPSAVPVNNCCEIEPADVLVEQNQMSNHNNNDNNNNTKKEAQKKPEPKQSSKKNHHHHHHHHRQRRTRSDRQHQQLQEEEEKVVQRIPPRQPKIVWLKNASESPYKKLKILESSSSAGALLFKAIHQKTGKIVCLRECVGASNNRAVSLLKRELDVATKLQENPNVISVLCAEFVSAFHPSSSQQQQQEEEEEEKKDQKLEDEDDQDEQEEDGNALVAADPASVVTTRIIFEYCANGSLFSLLTSIGPIHNESFLRTYARQLLTALKGLHQQGIVHRNIQPRTIFLSQEGNLKLASLHNARYEETMGGADARQRLSLTPLYSSPESIRGIFTEFSDLWSVGSVLVHAASGLLPAFGKGKEIVNSIMKSQQQQEEKEQQQQQQQHNKNKKSPSPSPTSAAVPLENQLFELMFFIAKVPKESKLASRHHPELPDHLSKNAKKFFKKLFVIQSPQQLQKRTEEEDEREKEDEDQSNNKKEKISHSCVAAALLETDPWLLGVDEDEG